MELKGVVKQAVRPFCKRICLNATAMVFFYILAGSALIGCIVMMVLVFDSSLSFLSEDSIPSSEDLGTPTVGIEDNYLNPLREAYENYDVNDVRIHDAFQNAVLEVDGLVRPVEGDAPNIEEIKTKLADIRALLDGITEMQENDMGPRGDYKNDEIVDLKTKLVGHAKNYQDHLESKLYTCPVLVGIAGTGAGITLGGIGTLAYRGRNKKCERWILYSMAAALAILALWIYVLFALTSDEYRYIGPMLGALGLFSLTSALGGTYFLWGMIQACNAKEKFRKPFEENCKNIKERRDKCLELDEFDARRVVTRVYCREVKYGREMAEGCLKNANGEHPEAAELQKLCDQQDEELRELFGSKYLDGMENVLSVTGNYNATEGLYLRDANGSRHHHNKKEVYKSYELENGETYRVEAPYYPNGKPVIHEAVDTEKYPKWAEVLQKQNAKRDKLAAIRKRSDEIQTKFEKLMTCTSAPHGRITKTEKPDYLADFYTAPPQHEPRANMIFKFEQIDEANTTTVLPSAPPMEPTGREPSSESRDEEKRDVVNLDDRETYRSRLDLAIQSTNDQQRDQRLPSRPEMRPIETPRLRKPTRGHAMPIQQDVKPPTRNGPTRGSGLGRLNRDELARQAEAEPTAPPMYI